MRGVDKLEFTKDLSSPFSFCVQLPARSSHGRGCHLKLSFLCSALNELYFIAKSESEAFSSANLDI